MRKKKFLSIIMSVIMILTMVPTVAFAANPETYTLVVCDEDGDEKVRIENIANKLDDGTLERPTDEDILQELIYVRAATDGQKIESLTFYGAGAFEDYPDAEEFEMNRVITKSELYCVYTLTDVEEDEPAEDEESYYELRIYEEGEYNGEPVATVDLTKPVDAAPDKDAADAAVMNALEEKGIDVETLTYYGQSAFEDKLVKGKGASEYTFESVMKKDVLYCVYTPLEAEGTVTFYVYVDNKSADTPTLEITRDFYDNATYEELVPDLDEIKKKLLEEDLIDERKDIEVICEWVGQTAWKDFVSSGGAEGYDLTEKAVNGGVLYTYIQTTTAKITIKLDGTEQEKPYGTTVNDLYDGNEEDQWVHHISTDGTHDTILGSGTVLEDGVEYYSVYSRDAKFYLRNINDTSGYATENPVTKTIYKGDDLPDAEDLFEDVLGDYGTIEIKWIPASEWVPAHSSGKFIGESYSDLETVDSAGEEDYYVALYDPNGNAERVTVAFNYNDGVRDTVKYDIVSGSALGWDSPVGQGQGTLDGWTPAGWFDEDGNQANYNSVVTEDTIFTARWERTVTLYVSDGSSNYIAKSFPVTKGQEVYSLDDVLTEEEIDNYVGEFDEVRLWYDWTTWTENAADFDALFAIDTVENFDNVAINSYVAAVYRDEKLDDFTVTFVSDGKQVKKVTVKEGQPIGEEAFPEDPELYGWNFEGWYAENGNKPIEADTSITTDDLVLNAKWTRKITLWVNSETTSYAEGGIEYTIEKGKETLPSIEELDLTTPIGENDKVYTWYTDGQYNTYKGGNLSSLVDSVNTINTATDGVNSYVAIVVPRGQLADVTVIFDPNNGGETTTENLKSGDTVTTPEEPTKDNRVFAGWFDKATGEEFDFTQPVTEDGDTTINLTAKWQIRVEYNVCYDYYNDKTQVERVVALVDEDEIDTILEKDPMEISTYANENDKAYGWFNNNQWQSIYKSKDAALTTEEITIEETIKNNANFAALRADGYTNTTGLRLFSYIEANGNRTPATITLVLAGGSLDDDESTITIINGVFVGDNLLDKIGSIEPTKDNRYFDGWYIDGEKVTDDTVIEGDVTVTAKWNMYVEFNELYNYLDVETKNQVKTVVSISEDTDITTLEQYNNTYPEEDLTGDWIDYTTWQKIDRTSENAIIGASVADINAAKSNDGNFVEVVINEDGDKAPALRLFKYIKEDGNYRTISFKIIGGENAGLTNPEQEVIISGKGVTKPSVTLSEGYQIEGWYTSYNEETGEFSGKVDFEEDTFTDNITLYANLQALVTYMYIEGNEDVEDAKVYAEEWVSINKEASLEMPEDKAIYGWYDYDAFYNIVEVGGDYTFDRITPLEKLIVTEPRTLYGAFVQKLTVTFSEGTGVMAENMPEPQYVEYGDTATEPTEIPTRVGYTFNGWKWNFNAPIYSDQIIEANWTLNNYKITYDPNGGEILNPEDTTRTIAYGTAYGSLLDETQVSKDGAKFVGWTLDENPTINSTLVKDTDVYLKEGDTTLYAVWDLTTIKVDYILNGGKVVDNDGKEVLDRDGEPVITENLEYGINLNEVRAAEKDGLEFEGWYTDADLTNKYDGTALTASTTVYAKYQANITLEVYKNDNFNNNINWSQVEVDEYSTYNLPTSNDLKDILELGDSDEIYAWYTADEWNKVRTTGIESATAINSLEATTETKLYALVIEHYTVTFDTDGGSYIEPQDVPYGGYAEKPGDPTKEGHTFRGWVDENGNSFNFEEAIIIQDTIIKATWARAGYTVTFVTEALDEGWTGSTVTVKYNCPVTSTVAGEVDNPDNVPNDSAMIRKGYTFTGWYLNGELFDLNTPITESIELVAGWRLNEFTATIEGTYTYTGNPIVPTVTIVDAVSGVDVSNQVEISYAVADMEGNNAQLHKTFWPWYAGTYTVTVTPKSDGDYRADEAQILTLVVAPDDISDGTFEVYIEPAVVQPDGSYVLYDPENLQEYTYDGNEIVPDVVIYPEGVTDQDIDSLEPDVDYDAVYTDNVNAGTATITLTAKGNYTGELVVYFIISRAQIDVRPYYVEIEPTEYTYDGTAKQPAVTVKPTKESDTVLEYGKDYNVGYMPVDNNVVLVNGQPVNAGEYIVVVEGVGNYNGTASSTPNFTINPRSIADATVSDIADVEETGSPITPDFTVTDEFGNVLVKDTDYEVEITNNVEPGEAKITITGKGNYTGTLIDSFTITEKVPTIYYTTGIVRYTSGRPIVDVKVTLKGTTSTGESVTQTTRTDDSGRYYFKNLSDGEYTVTYKGIAVKAILNPGSPE